jgi:hypothetical protein
LRLTVHFISRGIYWKAGDDVPDDELPDFVRKYPVEAAPAGNGSRAAANVPSTRHSTTEAAPASLGYEKVKPKPAVSRRYVNRGAVYRRSKEVTLKTGEPLFVKELEEFVQIGRVKADLCLTLDCRKAFGGRSATMTLPG